jgi:hypothetical protein
MPRQIFGLELTHHNSDVESPKKYYITKMFEISLARNQDHSSLELVQKNSNTKSTKEIFNHKIVCDRFCKGCQGNHDN